METMVLSGRQKFDLDLAKGKLGEHALEHFLTNAKVEVKTEVKYWKRTGNIAIEIAHRNKPSGITNTEADYWCHILLNEDNTVAMMFLVPIEVMRSITEYHKEKNGTRNLGDGYLSKCVLIPIKDLTDSLVIK